MDKIPAPDLWDLVIAVFHSSPNQLNNTKGLEVQGNLTLGVRSEEETLLSNFNFF